MEEFLARHPKLPMKAVLLLQPGFPGVGNWMADEILWRANAIRFSSPCHPPLLVTKFTTAADVTSVM